ncbi:molecular chaperone HtpG [Solimonas soli]|uniref:molecular chaperone HtpG n=1 Tax=Solimonas soli TaxID=413479 RepID=UPI0004888F2E|nr:molecular chaperone HtpG [Solimonas soli]
MAAEKREFQAEVRHLLHLMIHSLYSNKEIFLRELISNASDACDKLRFEAIADPALLGADELAVELVPDPAAGTLTIKDNGVGMSRDEVIENLGTIARSGTRKFLESLSGDQKKDAQLIGQFGVGFYSAYIVADKVTVLSKRADGEAVRWESDGQGEFTVEPSFKLDRGTEVILHLREDDKEFLEPLRLKSLVRKYSDHIGLPIKLRNDKGELETINQARAFWTRPKSELKDEDYAKFYEQIAHDYQAPLAWAHHKVEGTIEYTSLLYIPSRAPFDLWDREQSRGVQLYVKRVFIMDKAAELLPPYLRFVRGVVDTPDLPLNVSREILQGNRTVEKIRSALVKRVLDLLDDMAANKPDDYAKFWAAFGTVFKEGLVEDQANQERIARLCRFHSTTSDKADVTLEAYVARMPAEQTGIYYLTAETLAAARSSPHLEGFRARNFEVLLLTDRIDEWVVSHLTEFGGKKLVSVARASKDLEAKIETPEKARLEGEFKEVIERLQKALGERVEAVRLSSRLTESPSCLVAGEYALSRRLEEMLRRAGEQAPASRPILEINPTHPLVEKLKATGDDAAFADLGELLFGQALLAEGGQLDDPAGFVRRLNKLLLAGAGAEPSRIIVG